MDKIKIKRAAKTGIKTLNKGATLTEKVMDASVKKKDDSITDYGNEKIGSVVRKVADESKYQFSKNLKKKIQVKRRRNNRRVKKSIKREVKKTPKRAKDSKKVVDTAKKTYEAGKKLAIETSKKIAKATKFTIKALVSSIKAIISGTKALIELLIAGGWISVVVILVILLVAAICSSIFGIFFSGEKTGKNSITMRDVMSECNMEFENKLKNIQDGNPHDEYVLDGNMASWKDILIIYSVRISSGKNDAEVMTIDENKKNIIKDIFWKMNEITFSVNDEKVIEQGINNNELAREVQKRVLHIVIHSKDANQMKMEYNFNPLQMKQFNELNDDAYLSLWKGLLSGYYRNITGKFSDWKQCDRSWSNIPMGSSGTNICQIGCLVTSISILIEKSGVDTGSIKPFNPGNFVLSLNKNGGFTSGGGLIYGGISKTIPNFKYKGIVNLRGKSRDEKYKIISQYFSSGYYLSAEVKGATPNNQHWVAIIDVDANNIVMADPATFHTDMWSAYEPSRTSQFIYFRAN